MADLDTLRKLTILALLDENERLRDALELAKGRLELLLPADLPESDHPGATQYVLRAVYAALSAHP